MMLAETKTEFESKLSDFRESEKENTKNVEYFEENWLNCVSKWAKYERVNLPLNLQETNNPVEVVNKQFKGFSNKHASNSIAVCCASIFKYVRSTEINIEQDQISQFDFNLRDISIGKEVGRTKLKRKRPDIDNGQISLYSSSTVMSSTISAEASTASGNS